MAEKKRVRDALKGQHEGKKDAFLLDPDKIVLVDDRGSSLYDKRSKEPLNENLVLNIMAIGVHTPISVTLNTDTGEIECVVGRRRVLHNREANKRLRAKGLEPRWIPATVKRGDAATMLDLIVSENEHRKADSPSGRANKMQRMADLGRSHEHISNQFDCTVATVKNTLSLLTLPASVLKLVDSGTISLSHGYKLTKLDPDEAKKKAEKLKTEAPREPGKKKSKSSKRAREIVDGKKKKQDPAPAPAVPELPRPDAPDSLPQTEPRIRRMLSVIESSERIVDESKRMGAVFALRWVLGDEAALSGVGDENLNAREPQNKRAASEDDCGHGSTIPRSFIRMTPLDKAGRRALWAHYSPFDGTFRGATFVDADGQLLEMRAGREGGDIAVTLRAGEIITPRLIQQLVDLLLTVKFGLECYEPGLSYDSLKASSEDEELVKSDAVRTKTE